MKKYYLVCVECAIEHDGKFLIIQRPAGKHAEGLLSFPGGAVEELDEAHHRDILRSAVKREIFEEVGLTLEEPINYVTTSFFVDSFDVHVIDSIFHCKLKALPVVVPSEREVPTYTWMTKEEVNQAPNAADWLKGYLALL